VIEIDEGVGGPEASAQIVSRDDLSRPFQQLSEHLERLILQLDLVSLPAQFSRTQIEFEYSEASRMLPVRTIRAPQCFGCQRVCLIIAHVTEPGKHLTLGKLARYPHLTPELPPEH
jgi:hypothetical protein